MALSDPYAGRPADALKDEGNKMFSAGHFKEAVDLYTRALDIDPTNKVLFSNRSFANLRLVRLGCSLS
jgi:Tfp pilus assembly protein PilF